MFLLGSSFSPADLTTAGERGEPVAPGPDSRNPGRSFIIEQAQGEHGRRFGLSLAALTDRATRGKLPNGPIVFWNTHNSVDLAAQAPRPPDGSDLPQRFRAFLEAPVD